jgi:HEXXH motif-containing protein
VCRHSPRRSPPNSAAAVWWPGTGRRHPPPCFNGPPGGLDWNPLAATCAQVVGDIHLLRAAPGYDVSHSEPRWRRRIFVSVPERADDLGALRLAESVVHEAMHLHLTNHEIAEPLVTEFRRRMRSPWRVEQRSYRGVLHGLFVFSCLENYFRAIPIGNEEGIARHRQGRVDEIRAEIARLDLAQLCGGLTSTGAALARQWYNKISING